MKNLVEANNIVLDRLFYAIFPFRVWNHLFLYMRSHNEKNMCMFCTKIYAKNKKIIEQINKKLFVEIDKCISMQLQFGVAAAKDINLFVHTNVCDKKHMFDWYINFGILFNESMKSPFMIWKFYLDIGLFLMCATNLFCLLFFLVLLLIVENTMHVLQKTVLT